MIKGIDVELNGKSYTFPPLALGVVERFEEDFQNFGKMKANKQASVAIDLAFSSLKRNYPKITREEVAEMLDLSNVQEVVGAIMGVSGLVASSADEGAKGNKKK